MLIAEARPITLSDFRREMPLATYIRAITPGPKASDKIDDQKTGFGKRRTGPGRPDISRCA